MTVGGNGTILTSADGITWTTRSSGTSNWLNRIAYGNNTFVAVGWAGTILTSPDGTVWTARNSGTPNELRGVAHGNNTFVAVGYSGTILTSPEGTAWTIRNSGTSNLLRGVAYGNNAFVTVGVGGTILTSPDGIEWTGRTSGTSNSLGGVVYGNNAFVAVGSYGTILTSSDGTSWIVRTSGTSNSLIGVAYGNNAFVTVGVGGTILTSPDGTTWTARTFETSYFLHGMAYGNNTFVAVGGGGAILTSTDGAAWTVRTSGNFDYLSGVAYGNDIFVAVGWGGTILTSPDGAAWIVRPSVAVGYDVSGVAYGNNTFVAVGGGGTILQSDSTIDATIPTVSEFTITAESTTLTVAITAFTAIDDVGVTGYLVTESATKPAASDSGWSATAPTSYTFMTSGSKTLYAWVTDGDGNVSLAKSAGVNILPIADPLNNWNLRNPPWQDGLFSVTYGNNTFVAVGNGGTIIQSDPVIAIDNPDISISPAAVNFGYVSVGSIASAQTFTVSNNGNSDLLIGTITFTSATFDFTKEYDHCSGQTISPLGACMLQTIFLPASNGAKSATLSIPSDDPDTSILNVPLRGHGVVKGDLDNDGNVTLADALLALQVLGGSTPPALRADYAYSGVDIDGDETVGLAEALFILQKIAGLRVLAGNCTDGSGGSGTPAEQAACYLALLAVPETRLSGWLGLYDALGVPVLQDGVPLGSTGDDPVGPHYWQVWYASGLDLPGRGGIPLSDAGRMLAVSISDAEASAYGPLLIDDLRLAAQSSDPQVQLLGLFVRGRILRGPSHLDILDPAVTAEKAVIDLPTIQLIGWIAMRGALFQDVSTIIAPAPLMAEGLQPAPKKRSGIPPIADLKCSDLSNDKTTWANWVIDKIGGGFQLPGMDKALLPSIVSRFQTKYLQDLVPVIETTNKVAAVLDVLTSAIGAGLQYLAMDYDYSQSPLPLVRNKVNNCNEGTCDGEPGKITVRVEYNLGKIPDGDSLYLCYISFVNNAIGVSISFPTQGPIPNTEIFIEAGERIPELVLFSSRGTYSRVTTDENGQAEINILGRNKQGLPATATPREEISSIIVSSQLEEEGTISMASMFFDAMSVPFGGGIPATLSSLIDLLKTLHWKPWEIFIVVRDWTTDDITPPTDVTDLTVTSVSPSQLKLSWSASTDDVGVTGYNIYRDGKYLKSTVGTSAVDTGLTASTQYCYQVTAFDAARNESFKYSRVCAKTKKEDETRPTVISTSPAAGAMNVARTSTILVTFSKAMDPATITRNALTVSNGKSVLFAFYHSATHTAEFTLSTSLASNTEYTATISASVMDEVGNAMESNYTWSFLTRADATLVSIAVTPANPSVDKGLTQQFTATVAYSDGTSQKLTSGIIWNSSNTAVATVNTFGLAVGIAGGTSTITATSGTISGSTTLVVIAEAPGVNWTLRSSPGYSLEGVVWSGTQFVAVGWSGTLLASPDGAIWTAQSSGTASYLYGVAWSGTQFVAVGSDGTILTSP